VAAAPPKFVVPPAPAKKGTSNLGVQLVAMLKAHNGSGLVQYVPTILKWASVYKVDPLYLGSVLLIENPSGNPNAVSSAGAIKYLAWRMSYELNSHDSLDAAYNQGYNPGYAGTLPSSFLPKVAGKPYVPTTGPGVQATPAENAGPSNAGSNAHKNLNTGVTTWATLDKTGKFKYVTTRNNYNQDTGQVTGNPPAGVLRTFGQPLDQASFLQQAASITDQYLAYTGQRPNQATIAKTIRSGLSQYQLQQHLSGTSQFVGSPVWNQNAPGYEAVYKSVYGENAKLDTNAVKYAITNNLGSTGFQQYLRNQPTYTDSQEYKQMYAANANVFSQIYGAPSEADTPTIDQATKNGWDQNQFAGYLRQQPEWKGSAEAQRIFGGLAQKMGLIEGAQTVLGNG
jgi:hypothetical protein